MNQWRWRSKRRGVCSPLVLREMRCKPSSPFSAGLRVLLPAMRWHSAEQLLPLQFHPSVIPFDPLLRMIPANVCTTTHMGTTQSVSLRPQTAWRWPLSCCSAAASAQGIDNGVIERWNVVGLTAGDKLPVRAHFFVHPVSAGIFQICFERRP
jgi:hypothetical protein